MSPRISLTARHSTRTIKKSRRARESDENIPGINLKSSSKANKPDIMSASTKSTTTPRAQSVCATDPKPDAPSNKSVPPAKAKMFKSRVRRGESVTSSPAAPNTTETVPHKRRRRRPAGSTQRRKTAGPSVLPKLKKHVRSPPVASNSPASTPDRHSKLAPANDLFDILSLYIYPWPTPRPIDFTNLTTDEQSWRAEQDFDDRLREDDDAADADDWHAMSGNTIMYDESKPVWAYAHAIAKTFINRAKRAYRDGQTWEMFEDIELAIDSMSQARAIKDSVDRELHMREAVDNDYRLKLFSCMRRRLCLEIWTRPYIERFTLEADGEGKFTIIKLEKGSEKHHHALVKLSIPSLCHTNNTAGEIKGELLAKVDPKESPTPDYKPVVV